jgi:hypothetical protein
MISRAWKNFGGARRNRTADKGFADLCLTTWRPRPCCREPIGGAKQLTQQRSVEARTPANATIIAPSRPQISTQIFAAPRKNNSSQRTAAKKHVAESVDAAGRFLYDYLSKGA